MNQVATVYLSGRDHSCTSAVSRARAAKTIPLALLQSGTCSLPHFRAQTDKLMIVWLDPN